MDDTFVTARCKRVACFQNRFSVYSRVVKCITGNYHCFVCTVTITKSGGVVIHPWYLSAKLFHRTDVTYVGFVGYSVV